VGGAAVLARSSFGQELALGSAAAHRQRLRKTDGRTTRLCIGRPGACAVREE
jgi:hypothetical protein